MTKFLFTMNMPSAADNLVHQITGELNVSTCEELHKLLNSTDFILVRQYYRKKGDDEQKYWQDRGELIINVQHIGKVQEFIERENNDTSGNFGRGSSYSEAEGATVWKRR